MEELNFDNILGENEIETLFIEPETPSPSEEEVEETETEEVEEEEKQTDNTTEVDPETLFEEEPESVGSGKKSEGKEGTVPDEGGDTSPKHFYSSIANALAVDGIFPNLDEETVKKADSAESLSDLIEAEVNARFDEKQQRVLKALENGVEPTDIKKYENTLSYIDSITDAAIAEESEKGESLRRSLLVQDFLNKGYTPEKAQKLADRSIDGGNDIDDAKEALQSNKEYFQKAYNRLLKEAQEQADEERAERKQQEEKLRTSLLQDKDLLGDMELSQEVRRKAYEAISKPVYKNPETGEYLTALQKYEMEHRGEFLKYAGLLFTLTNGFKDFDSLAKGKVKKEMKKGLRELNQVLNTTRRSPDGNLRMVTSVQEDPESFIGKGMRLDL